MPNETLMDRDCNEKSNKNYSSKIMFHVFKSTLEIPKRDKMRDSSLI